MNSTKRGQTPMKRHLILVMVVLAVLVPAGLPQADQFKTKEEVLAHLIANSPYRGYVALRVHRGGGAAHISAAFTKEGGRLNISGTRRILDGDIKDLEIILKDDKITLTFMNSNPQSGARYNLELKDGKLVGTAKGHRGESDIELAPNPTK
jgi:hypothetical protein